MSFLYVNLGPKGNLFGRGTVTVSPAEASVAPKAGLYDSDPSTPHIAGSIAADSYMRVQTNLVTNGGFETAALAGWTVGATGNGITPVATATAGEFRSGAGGCELSFSGVPSSTSFIYQDFTVNPGEMVKVSVWLKNTAAGQSLSVSAQILQTGKYYDGSANTWGAGATLGSTAATSFTEVTETFAIDTLENCRFADTVTLRLTITLSHNNLLGGTAWVDDVLVVPGVTFASIHGHNYGPVSPLVQSSDDGSSWTTRATMTIQRPAFYSTFSAIYAEYWQIKLSGTPLEAPYTGEAVLGQYREGSTQIAAGPMPTWNIPGVRSAGTIGRPMVYNFATDATESIRLVFSGDSETEAREAVFGMFVRSGQGRYPVIIVPTDTESFVYYGRLMQPFSLERPALGIYDWGIDLVGDPFPTVGA